MEAIRLLKRRPWGIAGVAILLAVVLLAVLSPLIAPYPRNQIDLSHRLEPPSSDFVLGTNHLGQDVFSQLLYGSRPYVETGLIAVGMATVLGLLLGFLSAGVRGKVDSFLRIAILVPSFLIVLVVLANSLLFIFSRVFTFRPFLTVIAFVGNRGLFIFTVGLLLSFIFLPSVYTVTRRALFSAFNTSHVPGGSFSFHTFGHGLACLLPLTLVNLGIAVGVAVLVIAPLSYYGFGVPPGLPEWGSMLSREGRAYALQAPWTIIAPASAIAVTCLGLILFGLALREIWIPRLPGPLTNPEQSRSTPGVNSAYPSQGLDKKPD